MKFYELLKEADWRGVIAVVLSAGAVASVLLNVQNSKDLCDLAAIAVAFWFGGKT